MGRRKIAIQKITDERIRRVTFKKRRIGLLKKAIQLSKLTDATIELRIYNSKDKSLIEYFSNKDDELNLIKKDSPFILEYSRFYNDHYDLVNKIEESVTKHGNASGYAQCTQVQEDEFLKVVEESGVESINMMSLFSLAKRPAVVPDRSEKISYSPVEMPRLPVKRRKTDELECTLNAALLEDSVSKSTDKGDTSEEIVVPKTQQQQMPHKPIAVRIPVVAPL